VGWDVTTDELERRRRSIRLKAHDYASPGPYFVTACSYHGQLLFKDAVLREILNRTWYGLPERYPGVRLDSFVVMPNHVHFIVWLNSVGAPLAGAHDANDMARAGASPAPTLGDVVGTFKSVVATEWLTWLKENAPHRLGRVWQRNYYEHVVRDEDELARIREYVHLNAVQWQLDRENPHRLVDREYRRRWDWLEGG
jgi:putative transposase